MSFNPDNYAETPTGKLLIADGLNPVKIWDGLQAAPIDAGLKAPTGAPHLALQVSPNKGAIYGTYRAYVRFLDAEGNPSSLSLQSNDLVARVGPFTLTDATNTKPIRITATAHGLSTGFVVEVFGVEGNEAANGVWKVTLINANSFSLDDSDGDGEYTTGGQFYSGVSEIDYSTLPVPTSSKVVTRQVLRNTDGQLTTFYVDEVDTGVDLASTTGFTTYTDDTLATKEALPLLNIDGQIFANANEPPPDYQTCFIHHLGLMFGLVNKVYKEGAVLVTNGSATVVGIGTAWTANLAGRVLYALGATRTYEISSVDVANQTLTLTEVYSDPTDLYTTYSIKPEPALRRVVNYSRAGYPQSWSATYGLELQDNGDELTGGMTMGSFIYFHETSHISKLTFLTDPAVDGHVFPAVERGCINNRCWIQVEDAAYMLDSRGVHMFDGEESKPISTEIQPLFDVDGWFLAVNWKAAELFHAVHAPHEETIRWFVSLGSCIEPRHALVFHTRFQRWAIEEYPRPILSSTLGWQSGRQTAFLGAEANEVFVLGRGNLDGLDPATGKVVGYITAASICSLTDDHAGFPPDLAGLTVTIAKGKGYGQQRIIHSSTATTLNLTLPWLEMPDTTSVYQIAGIKWRFLTKIFEWVEKNSEVKRRFAIFFQPSKFPAWFHFQYFLDARELPEAMATTTKGEHYEGASATEKGSRLTIDQTRSEAFAQQRLAGHREINFDGPRAVAFELIGVSGQDGFTSSKIVLEGVDD